MPALPRLDQLEVTPDPAHQVGQAAARDVRAGLEPAGGQVVDHDIRWLRGRGTGRGDPRTAPGRSLVGAIQEVAIVGQALDVPRLGLDAPELEAAVDGRREGDPAAIAAPVDGAAAGAQQVRVHGRVGEQVGRGGQVLATLTGRGAEAPDIAAGAGSGRVPMAHGGDPLAIRAPGRDVEDLVAARRQALDPTSVGGHEVDVLLVLQVGVPMPAGDEGDARAVRAPAGLAVVRGAGGQPARVAGLEVDAPQLARPVVGEAGAVELVEEPVDLADVGLRRRLRGRARRRLVGQGRADDAEGPTVGTPGDVRDIAWQPGDLVRLAAIQGQEPDLRAALLGRLRRDTAVGCAGRLEDRGAIAQEGQRPAIGAPARGGVGLTAERQRPSRGGPVRGHDPEGVPITVAARSDRTNGEGDLGPVRRDPDLGRDAQVEQVVRARCARHAVTSIWVAGLAIKSTGAAGRRSRRAERRRRPRRSSSAYAAAVPTPVHQPTLELEAPLPSPPADLRPMLARTGHRLPASGEARLVDPTWGGLRVLAAVRGRSVRLLRDGRDIAADFPEIVTSLASLDLSDAVLDGEIVGQGAARTALAAHRRPPAAGPATLVISDLPWFGGRARIADHLVQRRERLAGLAIAGRHLVVVEAASGAEAVLQVVALHGLTGIVVKRADSPYLPGLRSRLWTLVRVADLRAADSAAALDEPGTVDGDGLAAASRRITATGHRAPPSAAAGRRWLKPPSIAP